MFTMKSSHMQIPRGKIPSIVNVCTLTFKPNFFDYTLVPIMDEPIPHTKGPVRDDMYYLESVIFLVSNYISLLKGNRLVDRALGGGQPLQSAKTLF